MTLVTLRGIGGAVLAVAWFGWRDRSVFGIRSSDTVPMDLFGLVSVTAFYLSLILTFRHSSVTVGTLLVYLSPVVVTLDAALWLDDRLTPVKLLALGMSLAGLVLIVEAWRPGGVQVGWAGLAFGLASAVTYGSYSLVGKPFTARYAPGTLLVCTLPIGAVRLMIVKLAASPAEWPSLGASTAIATWCGLVLTLLPFGLYTVGLSRTPASGASNIATIEPVLAAGFAYAMLGKRMGPGQLFGGACVVGSVLVLAASGRAGRSTRRMPLARATQKRPAPE